MAVGKEARNEKVDLTGLPRQVELVRSTSHQKKLKGSVEALIEELWVVENELLVRATAGGDAKKIELGKDHM